MAKGLLSEDKRNLSNVCYIIYNSSFFALEIYGLNPKLEYIIGMRSIEKDENPTIFLKNFIFFSSFLMFRVYTQYIS